MNLQDIKPTAVRKYLYEYALICLASAVITLFWMFNDLQKFIRSDLMQQNIEMQKTLEKNTSVMEQFQNQQRFIKPN